MQRQYVAIDLHRRRSLILRQNEAGEELGLVRIDNDPVTLAAVLAEAGPDPEVATMRPEVREEMPGSRLSGLPCPTRPGW